MLDAISPVDGRYANKTKELSPYFSEAALIRYRISVEVSYFLLLNSLEIVKISPVQKENVQHWFKNLTPKDMARVKEIEKVTNHDVKAVEYFMKEQLADTLPAEVLEFIHFGLTSQDINNTAMPLMIKEAIEKVVLPAIEALNQSIEALAQEYVNVPMLARTHGQPASPTTLGKELRVFSERLRLQSAPLRSWPFEAKFGGATGNFNAHHVAYPHVEWQKAADEMVQQMGLVRQQTTTQIEHYDGLASLFHLMSRINTILIDFSRDIWTYISMNYFLQKVVKEEVGSSAMPHKVNPIDFENAEGNLAISSSIFLFLAGKLPVSRLQRDLTDSTVSRNIGVPFAHQLIALKSLNKGIGKLQINTVKIQKDLDETWAVIAEGIQTILRKEGFPQPYEALKAFSRGRAALDKQDFLEFIDSLDVADRVKSELRQLTPHNYIGYASKSE